MILPRKEFPYWKVYYITIRLNSIGYHITILSSRKANIHAVVNVQANIYRFQAFRHSWLKN